MISLLAKLFLKTEYQDPAARRKDYGTLCGAVGIGLNVLLFLGKLFAGMISGSIAIMADAFNNLSDAGSSFVTLLGFRLAGQKPDPEHPFGHGRMEYLSGLIVAMLILLMGFELGKSALDKILHPTPVDSGAVVIVILCVSIAVKLYMAFYNRQLGRTLDSTAMLATASDSLNDSIATAAVLLATLASRFTAAPIDGWTGIVVSAFILWSGICAVKSTMDPLLGKPPTPELVQSIRELVEKSPRIAGIHDLIVHDYGPGRMMVSLHAEVSANENMLDIHDEIDNVERELQSVLGCHAVIHMDPIQMDDAVTNTARARIAELVRCIDDAITIHDFRMVSGPTHTNVIFDAVVPFGFRLSDGETAEKIRTAVRLLNENYYAVVNVERSYT